MARYAYQENFVPFIVEMGGRINCAGLRFLDKILPAQVVGDAAAARKRGWAAFIARNLPRTVTVAQIHAPDLTVEEMDDGAEGGADYSQRFLVLLAHMCACS